MEAILPEFSLLECTHALIGHCSMAYGRPPLRLEEVEEINKQSIAFQFAIFFLRLLHCQQST